MAPRLRLAFVAHAGRRIALRAVGPVPAQVRFPHELGPGDRLGGLAFADLAAAFRGVAEVDPATGEAVIVDRVAEGPPRRLRFRVDRRGVVALRAEGGHPWSEEVLRGRPAFGVPAEALLAAGEGVLELDPAGLEARFAEQPPPAASAGPRRPAATPARAAPAVPETRPDAAPRRRRPLLVWSGLIFLVATGVAGWWLLAGPAGYHWLPEVANWATGDSASLAEPGPATAGTSAPPGPARPAPPGGGIGDDPVMALEAFAGLAGDPALAAELRGIAAALRRERQAREEERGRAAATAIAAGAQLARVYRRDAADLRRLETAAGVCGEDAACRQRYGPALARAATARELTRDAYVRLLGQIAADYPQELLDRQLGAAAPASGAAARGNPDEAAALDDLAQRFVDQVARRREGGAAEAEPEALVGELLAGAPSSPSPEPLPSKQGSEP